jgi:hypothetical protein
MQRLDALGQTIIAGMWLAALIQAALVIVVGATLPWQLSQLRDDPAGFLADLPVSVYLVALALLVVETATAAAFVSWLYRARSNVDLFAEAQPDWARWWSVVVWFIPVVNLALAPVVVADVARGSADEVAGPETTRLVGRVWRWWLIRLGQLVAGPAYQFVAVPYALSAATPYVSLDEHLVYLVASPVLGVILALAGASAGGRLVGAVNREQRGRLERAWPTRTTAPV